MPNWPQWGRKYPDWREHPETRRLSSRETDELLRDTDLAQKLLGGMFKRLWVLPIDSIFDGTLLNEREES